MSFGKGCGRAKYPGVYVKIKNFLTWINMEIQKEKSENEELDDEGKEKLAVPKVVLGSPFYL